MAPFQLCPFKFQECLPLLAFSYLDSNLWDGVLVGRVWEMTKDGR